MNGLPALVGMGGSGANQASSPVRSGTGIVVVVDGAGFCGTDEVGAVKDVVGGTAVVETASDTVTPLVVVAGSALLHAAKNTKMITTPQR